MPSEFLGDGPQIVDLVKRNCGGATWETVASASIGVSKSGLLLVNQNAAVHAEVERLLNQLRLYK